MDVGADVGDAVGRDMVGADVGADVGDAVGRDMVGAVVGAEVGRDVVGVVGVDVGDSVPGHRNASMVKSMRRVLVSPVAVPWVSEPPPRSWLLTKRV